MRIHRAFLAAILLAPAAPAGAYQREEHYYSLRLALGENAPRLPGDEVVALCAQMADEAPELNPIAAYRRMMRHPFSYASWSFRDRGAPATVGRMITVQQLLHGLTGGSSEAARAIAVDTAKAALAGARAAPMGSAQRADALCALGFSLHFYGDSYAHRRIHNPARMYPTGLGHMFDGVTPDLPFYTPVRAALWRDYLRSLKVLFPEFHEEALAPFFQSGEDFRSRARDTNAYGNEDLRRLEAKELERLGVAASPLPKSGPALGCQGLLNAQLASGTAVPNCERAWTLYRTTVERAFAAYDADPAHAAAPSRGLIRPFYDEPLFEGAK